MKFNFRYQSARFLLLPFILCCAGCEKFVDINPPPTQVEAAVIFESDQAAISAVTGLYSRMSQTNLVLTGGGATVYPGLSADEIYNTTANADFDLFLANSLQVNNNAGIYTRLWRAGYQNIFHANAVLEGISESSSMTDSMKAQLTGEMLFVRAWNYFYLTSFYGNVPYITHTDYRTNQSLTNTQASDILQQSITDLKQAKVLLKETYPTANRARPNKWAVAALLARLYLYRKDWANAEAEATAVIQSGRYGLVTLLNNVFLTGSNETIWHLVRDNNNTLEGFTFIPSSATVKPTHSITQYLLNAFEIADKRKTSWLAKNTVGGIEYYYPYKYKVSVATPQSESYVVLRLAELYLIRAEARTMLGNATGAKADIDLLRTRAGLAGTTANTQPTLLSAIEKERQTELFVEWGHRWMDIIRWGRADQVFGPVKAPNWQPTDTLYPIPLREMETNPFLVQNPGYQ